MIYSIEHLAKNSYPFVDQQDVVFFATAAVNMK